MSPRYWMPVLMVLACLTPARGQTALEWKFKENDKFFADVKTKVEQTVKSGGQDLKQELEQSEILSFTVQKKNPDNSVVFEVVLEYLTYNASGAVVNPGNDALFVNRLSKGRFKATVGPDGQVQKVEGLDEWLKKVAGDDAAGRKLVGTILNEDGVKRSLGEVFSFLPKVAAKATPKKGDTWAAETRRNVGAFGTLAEKRTYTHEGDDKADGKAVRKIALKATGAFTPGKNPDAGIDVAKADLKVEEYQGTYQFDAEAGRLVQADVKMVLKGPVSGTAGGQPFQLELGQTETVKIKLSDKDPREKAVGAGS